MKRIWSILFVLICGMILYSYNVTAEEISGPKLVLKEKVFDFGNVIQGEIIEHAFIVANEGDKHLEITRVNPG
ncbi:MAG TPA: hypothetical protein PK874_07165 [Desulfobacteraceae bacterium]|nr:hypothetical protein [Desulfobacteraceae bacterium]HPJ66778.1 hypothetical protein [Desulfobacteraceae bacterium]HPQ26988.1 hypothetical protein [Desulfobacteraceae bacterium]